MPGTTITGRTSGTATGSTGQVVSGSFNIHDQTYRAQRGMIPFIANNFVVSAAAGDTDNNWLDVSDATNTTIHLVNVGAFSCTVQASLDGGKTFQDIIPDVGSTSTANPITAAGIYKYTGVYQYIRVHSTAIGTSLTVSAGFVRL